ncbi:type II toxin-antitoxin system RelE/ParE family toxin [Patescibacteria group bacterium]|nr:type II toxin-antitoxin system RelE/ParE family toxin [Patescibacteria group bacterium]MBU1868515.1 type II toxin-antitoxin system RelE/ParE family toxin [Patescibacteria group bacterium]
MPTYDYAFTSKSLKQLQKLPRDVQKRILKRLDEYCANNPLKKADRLTDFRLGDYRFRIGDWRVVFDLGVDEVLIIHLVGHRRDIYR